MVFNYEGEVFDPCDRHSGNRNQLPVILGPPHLPHDARTHTQIKITKSLMYTDKNKIHRIGKLARLIKACAPSLMKVKTNSHRLLSNIHTHTHSHTFTHTHTHTHVCTLEYMHEWTQN